MLKDEALLIIELNNKLKPYRDSFGEESWSPIAAYLRQHAENLEYRFGESLHSLVIRAEGFLDGFKEGEKQCRK